MNRSFIIVTEAELRSEFASSPGMIYPRLILILFFFKMSLAKVFQILQDLNRKFCSVAGSLLFLIMGFRTIRLLRLLLRINTFSKSPRGSLNFNSLNISINICL